MALFNLFPDTVTNGPDADTQPVSLGTEFVVNATSYITQIRWFRASGSPTGQRVGALYRVTGPTTGERVIGPLNLPLPSAGSWGTQDITPYKVQAGERYRVVVFHPGGRFPAADAYFSTGPNGQDVVRGPVTVPNTANALGNAQGSYEYGSSITYPTQMWANKAYFSDVTVSDVLPPYAVTSTRYGNMSPPLSANWYPWGAGIVWYGQYWNAESVFNRMSVTVRNTTNTPAEYGFELRGGNSADAPLLETKTVTVPPNTGTGGTTVELSFDTTYHTGAYHFRLLPKSNIIGNADVTFGRNTSFAGGNAVYANDTSPYLTSAQDLVFTYWAVPDVGEYFGLEGGTSKTTGGEYPIYKGTEFTTDRPLRAVHIQAERAGSNTNQTVRISIHRGLGHNAEKVYDSGNVLLPAYVISMHWVPFEFADILPAGTYQLRISSAYPTIGYAGVQSPIPPELFEGDATRQIKPSYYNFNRRFIFAPEGATPENTPKRWTGTEWVPANVQRWDGAAWVPAHIKPYRPPVARRWAVEPIHAAIDAATVATMFSADNEMNTAYGVTIDRVLATNTYNGYTYDAITADSNAVENFKLFVDELAKYPADFIAGTSKIKQIVMAPNLRSPQGVGLGGIAFDNAAGVTLVNTVYNGTGRFRDNAFVLNHELQHLIMFSASDTQLVPFRNQWIALNPEPYIGDNYVSLTGRPSGHLRTYGRSSFMEDTADIFGSMMVKNHQEWLETIIEEDPIVRQKVYLMRQWMGSLHPVFRDPLYFWAVSR